MAKRWILIELIDGCRACQKFCVRGLFHGCTPCCAIMVLGGKYGTVHKALYDAVRFQVEDVLPALVPGVSYKAKQLAGETFWSELKKGERTRAGHCLSWMVANGILPLARVMGPHEYSLRYRRI